MRCASPHKYQIFNLEYYTPVLSSYKLFVYLTDTTAMHNIQCTFIYRNAVIVRTIIVLKEQYRLASKFSVTVVYFCRIKSLFYLGESFVLFNYFSCLLFLYRSEEQTNWLRSFFHRAKRNEEWVLFEKLVLSVEPFTEGLSIQFCLKIGIASKLFYWKLLRQKSVVSETHKWRRF